MTRATPKRSIRKPEYSDGAYMAITWLRTTFDVACMECPSMTCIDTGVAVMMNDITP